MKRIILGAVVASVLITVPVVLASGPPDGNTLTANLKVKAANSGNVSFTVTNDVAHVLDKNTGNALTTDGHAVVVTCSVSSTTVPIPAPTFTGTASPAGKPKFASCTNNLKVPAAPTPPTIAPPGTCTALPCPAAVGTAGVWTSTYNDGSDAAGEVLGSGDTIGIQGGTGDVLSVASSAKECLINGNPSGTDGPAVGAYNDATGVDTISGASLSFSIIQNPKFPTSKHYPLCALIGDSGTASFSGTYQLSPVLTDS